MEKNNIIRNPDSNKFDTDIIQKQSYKIIDDNSLLTNNNSNNKSNYIYNSINKSNTNRESLNNNYNDNEDDLNRNININNYLYKNNIIQKSNNNKKMIKQKELIKKVNSAKNKGYLLSSSYTNIHINNKLRNLNNKKDKKDLRKEKLLERMRQQKESLQIANNNTINKKNDELNIKKNVKNENGNNNKKKEKEESKHIPKILTFLRTFKNFALPLKPINEKKEKDNNNNALNKTKKEKEANFIVNSNKSCYNFNSKVKPYVGNLNLDKRNQDSNFNNKNYNDKNEKNNENEGEEFIDYNRFTFRNNIDEDDNSRFKTFDRIPNEDYIYSKKDKFNDINQNINIDEYNRKQNNYNSLRIEEVSPNFKRKKIINNIMNDKKPYLKKKYLLNKYNSPKPQPKGKINNNMNVIYAYNNNPKNDININKEQINNYNSDEKDDSFQSLNISRRYRKPILNISFQRNNYLNKMSQANSGYYNDISADQINLSNNYHTINRPLKNNKIREIVININDSLESFNDERNYNTNNNLYSNRSPIKRKNYNTNTNSYFMKRSPLSSKPNGGNYEISDNYDTSLMGDEDENYIYNKKNTNFSRFMEPFQKNENKKWYNEDSYLSFDIVNINKTAKNQNLLYQKPLKRGINKNLNKNNSMYIKRVVHYDNKKNSFFNDSDYINDSDYKNKPDFTDYEEKENNVFDFDAPRAIKDSIEDYTNNSEFISDSARENQFSVNSDINTNKINTNSTNNQNNNNDSKIYVKKNSTNLSQRGSKKMIYMKKLNTVYNFYQGTKNLLSKLNDKVFKIHNKDGNNNSDKNNDKNNNNKNNEKNNLIKKEDQGVITPRMKLEKEGNNTSFLTINTMNTPMVNYSSKDNDILIKTKIKNNNKCFYIKYYNYYLPKINRKIIGNYFSKFSSNKVFKIPLRQIYYISKENIKIYKIPININRCYFQKVNIINNNNLEHHKIFSFFSLGENYINNINENNDISDTNKNDENKKIKNLKQNILIKDKQEDSKLLNNDKMRENSIDRNSFSFKDNNNILNSNNFSNDIFEKIEINNFYFSLSPPIKENNKNENKNIIENNNNLIIINNQENKENDKNNKYEYKYILSLKNNKFCNMENLLPEKVIEHLNNLKKEIDIVSINNKKNNKENKYKTKFKKGEIEKIIKKYLTPNKKEEIKKILNKKSLSDNKEQEIINNNKKLNYEKDSKNMDENIKMEWIRKDLSKEIHQAEEYIKELKKKMEENTKKNDFICLLNMLTVDNLKLIVNKLMDLIIKNNEEILSDKNIIDNEYILIKIIVDKAITEKRFVNLYANLCYELYHQLNNKKYNDINFKTILMEECKIKFSDINNIDNNSDNKIINLNDEKYFIIKKKFLGNIDFICELINVDILTQEIGFYYLEDLFKKYNNIKNTNEIENFKKYLCLEAIVNFLSKFGKKIYEKKNENNSKYLNNFIDNNLNSILNNQSLPGYLKYKIINLIEKQKNKWKDSLYEKSILVKGKNSNKKNNGSSSLNKSHKLRKRRHSNNKSGKTISPDSFISNQKAEENNKINTYKNIKTDKNNYSPQININININNNNNNNNEDIIKLIEKDLENYEIFLKDNNINNKYELEKNSQIGNEYDWSTVEDILSKSNVDLSEVIRCYVEVCIDQITNNSKIFIANDYIKNIIYYYSNNLTNKEKDKLHNKMITLFRNIQDICIDNLNMKEIMGYLLFILIENKLNFIKDLNNFIGIDKEIIITIAEVIKFAILSSEEKCKKYHNDFKQTKLFVDNSIFNDYVTKRIQNSLF